MELSFNLKRIPGRRCQDVTFFIVKPVIVVQFAILKTFTNEISYFIDDSVATYLKITHSLARRTDLIHSAERQLIDSTQYIIDSFIRQLFKKL